MSPHRTSRAADAECSARQSQPVSSSLDGCPQSESHTSLARCCSITSTSTCTLEVPVAGNSKRTLYGASQLPAPALYRECEGIFLSPSQRQRQRRHKNLNLYNRTSFIWLFTVRTTNRSVSYRHNNHHFPGVYQTRMKADHTWQKGTSLYDHNSNNDDDRDRTCSSVVCVAVDSKASASHSSQLTKGKSTG